MTTASSRKQIILIGRTNTGKSSLFNALLNQEKAIVSSTPGTTTDPVEKAMELLPYGPITLLDTAGLADTSVLGKVREEATRRLLTSADLVLYLIDSAEPPPEFAQTKTLLEERDIPYILVHSKADLQKNLPKGSLPVSVRQPETIEELRRVMIKTLQQSSQIRPLVGDLFSKSGIEGVVILVIPIDSAAPVGRIILPQVQVIRDCLDHNLPCIVVNEKTLRDALMSISLEKGKFLIVTDSQIFGDIEKLIPADYPLTSFSMLMARQKGDFDALYKAADALTKLKDGDKILISENCTHNHTHEDIGHVKIPAALKKLSGAELKFDFVAGKDFPSDLTPYALVVHCGGCMITARTFESRQKECAAQNVPMTNYGMVLAAAAGILERSMEVFAAVEA